MSDRRTPPTLTLRDRASTAGAAGELHTLLEGAVLHTFDVPGGGENPQRARLEWSGVRWFLMYDEHHVAAGRARRLAGARSQP